MASAAASITTRTKTAAAAATATTTTDENVPSGIAAADLESSAPIEEYRAAFVRNCGALFVDSGGDECETTIAERVEVANRIFDQLRSPNELAHVALQLKMAIFAARAGSKATTANTDAGGEQGDEAATPIERRSSSSASSAVASHDAHVTAAAWAAAELDRSRERPAQTK